MQDSKEIQKATRMYLGSGNFMSLSPSLHLETGSEKFKMAAAKPEVPVSQLLYKIAKKFERLPPCFRGRETQWRYREVSILKPEVRNSRWRLPNRKYLYLLTILYRRRDIGTY